MTRHKTPLWQLKLQAKRRAGRSRKPNYFSPKEMELLWQLEEEGFSNEEAMEYVERSRKEN